MLEIICGRRSVRSYTDKPVSSEDIEKILKAGMNAPSAGNERPWEFVVIDDRDILSKMTSFHPYAHMVTRAPVAIVVCGNMEKVIYGDFWIQDCSAATQNMLLMIHALGLGAVWAGLYPEMERVKGMQKLLNIPDTVIPLSLIPIGYPTAPKNPNSHFDRERIHNNYW